MKTNLEKWKDIWREDEQESGAGPRFTDMAKLHEQCMEEDKLMDAIFVHHKRSNTLAVNSTYCYEIGLERIPTPMALLHWSHHLCEKTWMPKEFIREFMRRVSAIKGWDIYSDRCERK